jgi:type I restriction enzyme M protein
MTLHGQDSNPDTVSMCKMNMVLHEISDTRIEHGDVLENPKLIDGSELIKYDRILANFPFSESWKHLGKDKDSFNRFNYGVPPGEKKADMAFIQHIIASLNETGRAAIVSGQGTLFRSGKEKDIRKNMILGNKVDNIQGDIIEGIITLPKKLFYGTTIPGCVFLLNKNKPTNRKNKIIFINGDKKNHYAKLPARNKLRQKDIDKIKNTFKNFKNEYGFSYVADLKDTTNHNFNLNVARYVDTSEFEKLIDISKVISEINELNTMIKSEKITMNEKFKKLNLKGLQ